MTNYDGRMTATTRTAESIKGLCKTRGISYTAVAESAGIADKTFRRRLNDPDGFKLGELSAVARVLEVELEELVAA